jgi:hypothetical protein
MSRKGTGLFSELKAKIGAKLNCNATAIGQILIKKQMNTSTQSNEVKEGKQDEDEFIFHEIATDRDVYLLKDMDLLVVNILSEEEQKSPVVVHEELPKLTYEQYVQEHWCPRWAGFYLIGKATPEEEAQIIQALFNSPETAEYL